jgi:hypothetical protein
MLTLIQMIIVYKIYKVYTVYKWIALSLVTDVQDLHWLPMYILYTDIQSVHWLQDVQM